MRLELTHGSGAKTFLNSHQQLIHISLDGQYHLLGEKLTLSLKQLEEIVTIINRSGGRWDDPAVSAKVKDLQAANSQAEASPTTEADPPAGDKEHREEDLKQQLA